MPPEFTKIKKLGKGAYGSVMQIIHNPTGREYACKRFEDVFANEQRATRLLREINVLARLEHPCVNKLKCLFIAPVIEEEPVKPEKSQKVKQNPELT